MKLSYNDVLSAIIYKISMGTSYCDVCSICDKDIEGSVPGIYDILIIDGYSGWMMPFVESSQWNNLILTTFDKNVEMNIEPMYRYKIGSQHIIIYEK